MKIINKLPLFMTILLVTLFSCTQEEESLSGLQGTVRFGDISLEFAPMGSPGSRITENSTWVHVFPDAANLVFINKATGMQYVLEYNPNDFSTPYSITLPYGAYEYHSIVEGEVFSAFLPFEARGEFTLDSQSLEISLGATTEYGLVTVKDQYVEKASISDGEQESDLVEHPGKNYWFLYVNGGSKTTLNIRESFQGTTISRELNIEAYRHYNFLLMINEGAASITDLLLALFELEEEEILLGSGSVFFEENGTIKCPGAAPGEKGKVNGKVYEAVDRGLMDKRIDEGADLTCVCTSLVTDMSWLFHDPIFFYDDGRLSNIPYIPTEFNQPIGNWDVSNVTTMSGMFLGAINFNHPIGNWDVGNVKNMDRMFEGVYKFNQPIRDWDVSNVTNLSGMLEAAQNFNQPMENWDVSNVTDMSRMFYFALKFNQPIGNWDVSKVTNLSGMFREAFAFNQPIGNWDVRMVTDMHGMFWIAPNFNQPLGNWDVSNVMEMSYMFHSASNFNQPIGNWDVSKVTNMSNMFERAQNFNQPIGNWDVRKVTDMGWIFSGASNFNQPIGNWEVGNVTDMGWMFSGATNFNQPIETWIVAKVTNMIAMFYSASSFNQPIGNWDVSIVTNMGGMFSGASDFNQPIGKWNVGNVSRTYGMFSGATNFNQSIEDWDVSNVTTMNRMFNQAFNFNQPIGDWEVEKVEDMSWMFKNATLFNQDLSEWCVQNIPSEPENFALESALLDAKKPVWGTCPE